MCLIKTQFMSIWEIKPSGELYVTSISLDNFQMENPSYMDNKGILPVLPTLIKVSPVFLSESGCLPLYLVSDSGRTKTDFR